MNVGQRPRYLAATEILPSTFTRYKLLYTSPLVTLRDSAFIPPWYKYRPFNFSAPFWDGDSNPDGEDFNTSNDNKATRYGHLREFQRFIYHSKPFTTSNFALRMWIDLSDCVFTESEDGEHAKELFDDAAKFLDQVDYIVSPDGFIIALEYYVYVWTILRLNVVSRAYNRTLNRGSYTYWLRDLAEFDCLNKDIRKRFPQSVGLGILLDYYLAKKEATVFTFKWLIVNLPLVLAESSELKVLAILNSLGIERRK